MVAGEVLPVEGPKDSGTYAQTTSFARAALFCGARLTGPSSHALVGSIRINRRVQADHLARLNDLMKLWQFKVELSSEQKSVLPR